jgi:hypothetical protein
MALAVTATYNNDLGRVQIAFTGANTDADYAKVEWSRDQITWSTIRGGDTVAVVAGAGKVDHYDGYVFGSTNYYRVTAIDAATPGVFGTGSFATANNASVVPGLPAGTIPTGAKLLLFATHANPAASITTPTGWTLLAGGGSNAAVFYRDYAAGVTAPTVAFTGGSAGDSCSAQIRAFLNVDNPVHLALSTNSSAQNVAYPTATVPSGLNALGVMHLWKGSVFTGVTTVPTQYVGAGAGGGNNTAGSNDESQLHYYTSVNPGTIPSGTVTYTGGVADVSKARVLYLPQRVFTDQGTTSTVPVLPSPAAKPYWLMNPSRPGQNVRVEITDFSELTQAGRTGVFDVVGRSYPAIVSDVMESNEFEFTIDAANKTEAKEIAGRIALGDPMYLLVADPNADIDTFYFTALSMKRSVDTPGGSWSITVHVREVAQPAPAVYGSTYIWQDVITNYASWTAVLADPQNTSWSNLMDRVSTTVIVVP